MKVNYPITFFYVRDLERETSFYRDVLGFSLVLDQGWIKYFALNDWAQLGLVDASRGSIKASDEKPVLLSFVVDDPDYFFKRLKESGYEKPVPEPVTREDIGIRAFIFEDPEGYKLEFQKFLK
ncbi:MAG: VOC family protein [Caldiserica bacterium]|jgi:catechol 2,3-dioxygenase-like lactoylglutathione lyase family enzyme|nr:VOC family protein [Caldisericota bacterium]MDH7561997.1 VOC family protein [Caldisericota bacterium]